MSFKKLALFIVVILLGLILVGGVSIYAYTESLAGRVIQYEVADFEVDMSAENLERGKGLFTTRGCVDCHGEDGGGKTVVDDPAIGRLAGTNLTKGVGGVAAKYNRPADWDRSIRFGLNPDGRPLFFMPSHEFVRLSKKDTNALIAHIMNMPAVDRDLGGPSFGPLARVLYVLGEFPLAFPHDLIPKGGVEQPDEVPVASSVEYGQYLANGCVGCHGEGLKGGKIPGVPPDWPLASDISADTGRISSWTFEQFLKVMREGKTPDGRDINPMYMPWPNFGKLNDTELEALFKFLQAKK